MSLRMNAADYINRRFLPPDQRRNWDIIFGGKEDQHIELAKLPYVDDNGKEKHIICAVYNVLRKTLPSKLPNLLPPLKTPPPYEIRDVPGKGKGMIATRDIPFGEMVIIERPVLIFPLTMRKPSVAPFREYAKKMMDPEDWKELWSLVNSRGPELSEFEGITTSNSFGIDLKPGKEDYCAVCLEIARLNHSCGPNLELLWNPELFVFSAQAVRPIRAGQELTVTYVEPWKPHAERRRDLERNHKFKCKCGYCTNRPPDSNSDREFSQLKHVHMFGDLMYGGLFEASLPWDERHEMAVNTYNALVRGVRTLEREGIESLSGSLHYTYLMKLAGVLGEKKLFKEWGFKVLLLSVKRILTEGEEADPTVEALIDILRDPEKNFSEWDLFQIGMGSPVVDGKTLLKL